MAISTRSRTSSPIKKAAEPPSNATVKQHRDPLKHFILPKELSESARFIILSHPQSLTPQRFLLCPQRGLFQFTKVNATSTDPRSLLFSNTSEELESITNAIAQEGAISNGYISKAAELFVATPFDTAFILVALVLPAAIKSSKPLFQPLDDILEQHIQDNKHLRYLFIHGREFVEVAMARFCDTIEAGDEQLYRPSEEKTLQMIIQKVDSAISNGLPASLEDKFVKRKLELPMLGLKREESIISTKSGGVVQDDVDSSAESFDSQLSATISAPSLVFSEVSTTSSVTTIASDAIPKEIHHLQKQSTVLDFILASYVPASIAQRLKARFSAKGTPIDFAPLDEYLKTVAAMKAEAAASRSISDFSRKRGLEDDEATELREEKRRKEEEEERKRKAGESRGVRELKKVNVSGMKKMSDFFAKKPLNKVK